MNTPEPPAPEIIGYVKRNNGIRGPGFAEWEEPVYATRIQPATEGGDEPCRNSITPASNAPVAVQSGDQGPVLREHEEAVLLCSDAAEANLEPTAEGNAATQPVGGESKGCPFCGKPPESEKGRWGCANTDCPAAYLSLSLDEWNTRDTAELERLKAEVAQWKAVDRVLQTNELTTRLRAELTEERRKREEAEARSVDWLEFYTAEVLLDDTDIADTSHDSAVQRLFRATERLAPLYDGSAGKAIQQAREFAERENTARESSLTASREEARKLREAIQDAPHDESCGMVLNDHGYRGFSDECDCWKSAALAQPEEGKQ